MRAAFAIYVQAPINDSYQGMPYDKDRRDFARRFCCTSKHGRLRQNRGGIGYAIRGHSSELPQPEVSITLG